MNNCILRLKDPAYKILRPAEYNGRLIYNRRHRTDLPEMVHNGTFLHFTLGSASIRYTLLIHWNYLSQIKISSPNGRFSNFELEKKKEMIGAEPLPSPNRPAALYKPHLRNPSSFILSLRTSSLSFLSSHYFSQKLPLPMDFHSLARRDLQALCKKNKIPANLTNLAMADALQSLKSVRFS